MAVLQWVGEHPIFTIVFLLVVFGGVGELIRALRGTPKAVDDD